MLSTNQPVLVPRAFADGAASQYINVIPEASQGAGPTPWRASLTDGFPAITFMAPSNGGVAPLGQDFNGILNLITQSIRYWHGGGPIKYNSTFANDIYVQGYPKGAVLSRNDATGFWFNTSEANVTDPEGGTPANWVPGWNYGQTLVTGLAGTNYTLSNLEASRDTIVLSGTLTGNISLIFPQWVKQWTIVNNTSSPGFTITARTALGTGPQLIAGATYIVRAQGSVSPDMTFVAGTTVNNTNTGQLINVLSYVTSGTYTPTNANVRLAIFELVGGGGGGGFGASSAAGNGGGSGGGVRHIVLNPTAAAFVIGQGGTGGTSGNAGNAGTSTTIYTLVAGGGQGGGLSLTAPATGGIASAANVMPVQGAPGQVGVAGPSPNFVGGKGGDSPFGYGLGGICNSIGNPNAAPAVGFGSGGAGSGNANSTGGNGRNGVLVVYEYT